ncbi:hypothetical protein HNY73_010486 [Argiope bruennichi]|uniref:Spidroin N-terminal domain-containing protein n=1 Tax=Argiope bruennichi TaxID=94029 RepID=A0A8T0F348_ARGBR|nr:hypothetical protein HNY73_010486 [Argiope bruennichi]
MDWHFRLLFAIIFVSQQWYFSNGRRFNFSDNNPFANYDTAEAFTRSFVQHVIQYNIFGNQTVQDIEGIVDTLVMAMKESSQGQTESRTQIKAMTMAFASSIAELIVAENSQEMDIQKKTHLIVKALEDAFKETTGEVNRGFIQQVKILVELFSLESGETESFGESEIDEMPYSEIISIGSLPSSDTIVMPFDAGRMLPEMPEMMMMSFGGAMPGQMEEYSPQGNMMNLPQYMSWQSGNVMQEKAYTPESGEMMLGAPAPTADGVPKESELNQFEIPESPKAMEMFFNLPSMWSMGQLQGFPQPIEGQNMPMEMEARIPGPYPWQYGMVPSGQQPNQPMMFMTGERSPMENNEEKPMYGLRVPSGENNGMDMKPDEIESFMPGVMPPKGSADDKHPKPQDSDRKPRVNLGMAGKPTKKHPSGSGHLLGAPAPTQSGSTNAPMGYEEFFPMETGEYIEPYELEGRMPAPYSWRFGMMPQMDQQEQSFMYMMGERQPTDRREFMGAQMPSMENVRMGMNPEENKPFMGPQIPSMENVRMGMNPEENESYGYQAMFPRRYYDKKSQTPKQIQNDKPLGKGEPSGPSQNVGKAVQPDKNDSSGVLLGAPAPGSVSTTSGTTVNIGHGVRNDAPKGNYNNNNRGIEVDEDITIYINGRPVGEKDIREFFNSKGQLEHFEEFNPQEKSSQGPLTMQAPSSLQQISSTTKENTTPATTSGTSSSTQASTQTSALSSSTKSSMPSIGSSVTPSITSASTPAISHPTKKKHRKRHHPRVANAPMPPKSMQTSPSSVSGGSPITTSATTPASTPTPGSTAASPASGGSSGTPGSTSSGGSPMTTSAATPASTPTPGSTPASPASGGSSGTPDSPSSGGSPMTTSATTPASTPTPGSTPASTASGGSSGTPGSTSSGGSPMTTSATTPANAPTKGSSAGSSPAGGSSGTPASTSSGGSPMTTSATTPASTPTPGSTPASPASGGSSGTPGSTSSGGSPMTTSATTPASTPTPGSTPASPASGGSSGTPGSTSSGGSPMTTSATTPANAPTKGSSVGSSPAGGSSGTPATTSSGGSPMTTSATNASQDTPTPGSTPASPAQAEVLELLVPHQVAEVL